MCPRLCSVHFHSCSGWREELVPGVLHSRSSSSGLAVSCRAAPPWCCPGPRGVITQVVGRGWQLQIFFDTKIFFLCECKLFPSDVSAKGQGQGENHHGARLSLEKVRPALPHCSLQSFITGPHHRPAQPSPGQVERGGRLRHITTLQFWAGPGRWWWCWAGGLFVA